MSEFCCKCGNTAFVKEEHLCLGEDKEAALVYRMIDNKIIELYLPRTPSLNKYWFKTMIAGLMKVADSMEDWSETDNEQY